MFMKNYLFVYPVFISICFSEVIRPSNNDNLNYIHVLFEWEQEPDTYEYNIQISDSESFDSIIVNENEPSTVYIEKSAIDWQSNYYWRVRPVLSSGSFGNWIQTKGVSVYSFNTSEPQFNDNISVSIYNDSLIQGGLVAFGMVGPELASGVIDKFGREVWNDGNFDFTLNYVNEIGNIFGFSTVDYPLNTGMKTNTNMDVVWSVMDQFNPIDIHEFKQLPNGNYMGFIRENFMGPIPNDNYMTQYFENLGYLADGLTPEFLWFGQKIIEWNEQHQVVWEWSPLDHFSVNDYDNFEGTWYSAYFDQAYDWMHSNAFHFDEKESVIYVSHRHLSRISKIDYPSGIVIWNMGLSSEYMSSGDEHICTDLLFSFQHNIQLMENGDLLFFDNGNLSQGLLGDENPISRIRRVKVIDNSYCETVWQFDLPPNLFGQGMGSVQALDNGNYSIYTFGSGLGSPECSIIEVTQEKEIIWKATGQANNAWYRSYKIPSIHPDAFSVIVDGYTKTDESTSGLIKLIGGEPIKFVVTNKSGYRQIYHYEFNDINVDGDSVFLDENGQVAIEPYSSFELKFFPQDIDAIFTNAFISVWPKGHGYSTKELFFNVSFEESVIGDINLDGFINILDIVGLVNIILDSVSNSNSDLNQDGSSNILDVVLLVGIILD